MTGQQEQQQQQQQPPSVAFDRDTVYTAIDTLDDPDFQAGLGSILSSAPADQIESVTDRAKVFYYSSKTGQQLDYHDFAAWKAARRAPHPASFDAIVQLIATGQTDKIPGIRDIPLKVRYSTIQYSAVHSPPSPHSILTHPANRLRLAQINEQQPTKPTLERPTKPWEKNSQEPPVA